MSKSCKSWRGRLSGRNKNAGGGVMWCLCGRKCSNEVKHISSAWVCLVCMSLIGLWCNRNADPTLPSSPCFPTVSLSVCLHTCACPLCKLILYHPHSKSWADKPARRWQKKRITSFPCSRLNNKWSFVPRVCLHWQIEWKQLRQRLNKHSGFLNTTLFLNLPTKVTFCMFFSFACCYIHWI